MCSRKVRIGVENGTDLYGDLHQPSDPSACVGGVLIVHGFKGFKDWGFFPYLAQSLAAHGLITLRFNLSGCGIREEGDRFDAPERFESNTYSQELTDLAAAWRYLRREAAESTGHPLACGLLGHSRGGAISILHAAADPSVRSLVTWSAIARLDRYGPEAIAAWKRGESVPVINARTAQTFHLQPAFWEDIERNRDRHDPVARASEVEASWLVVHGEVDETVSIDEARMLFEASKGGKGEGRTRLLRVPLTGHTFGAVHPFQGTTRPLDRAVQASAEWFVEHLVG